MVEILCPHCEEEIMLEKGSYGDFECPHCEGEFEWGSNDGAGERSSKAPMKGVTAVSHTIHGIGVVLLIIALFSNWVVILGGAVGFSPFGITAEGWGGSMTLGWFETISEGYDEFFVVALAGILLMLLAIIAVVSQIIHIAFRIMLHLAESHSLEISLEMLYRAHTYRWHTSLTALVCTVVGYLLVQVGAIISIGVEGAFPRPTLLIILLIGVLVGQVYLMREEGLMEE
jgi:hypothetical protein